MRIIKVNLEVITTIIDNLVIIDQNFLRLRKTERKTITRNLASLEEPMFLGRVQVIPQVMKAQIQVYNRPGFASWKIERRRKM